MIGSRQPLLDLSFPLFQTLLLYSAIFTVNQPLLCSSTLCTLLYSTLQPLLCNSALWTLHCESVNSALRTSLYSSSHYIALLQTLNLFFKLHCFVYVTPYMYTALHIYMCTRVKLRKILRCISLYFSSFCTFVCLLLIVSLTHRTSKSKEFSEQSFWSPVKWGGSYERPGSDALICVGKERWLGLNLPFQPAPSLEASKVWCQWQFSF